jgi:hypothetical protein
MMLDIAHQLLLIVVHPEVRKDILFYGFLFAKWIEVHDIDTKLYFSDSSPENALDWSEAKRASSSVRAD